MKVIDVVCDSMFATPCNSKITEKTMLNLDKLDMIFFLLIFAAAFSPFSVSASCRVYSSISVLAPPLTKCF